MTVLFRSAARLSADGLPYRRRASAGGLGPARGEAADLDNDGKPDIAALDLRTIADGNDFWRQMPYAGAG